MYAAPRHQPKSVVLVSMMPIRTDGVATQCMACREPLRDFLDKYKHEAGLAVHWIWVGPNGRATRPESGGVLPYYTLCDEEAAWQVKTIVNTFYLRGLATHPHNFMFRCVPLLSSLVFCTCRACAAVNCRRATVLKRFCWPSA